VKKRACAILIALFGFTALFHWYAGTFHSDFGRYADEGMHYVTGLMVHDYVLSGKWAHPVAFAKEYYLHFPKVGLGQWPPMFYVVQTAWTLVFGVSRYSLLFLMVALTAALATLVYRELEEKYGWMYALLAALLLIAAPLTQAHTAMVMAEIPLAIFSLLAVLAWIRLLEREQGKDAFWFAVWLMAALMTKGNAWSILPVLPATVVLTGRWAVLRNRQFLLAIGLVLLICVPYHWFTLRIVSGGMDTQSLPGVEYLALSLMKHCGFVVGVLGVPLSCVAAVGVIDCAVIPLLRRKASVYWIALASYGASIIAFHVMVPTSIESRKIYQIVPVVCIFVVAGADAIARLLSRHFGQMVVRAALLAIIAVLFLTTSFYVLDPYTPGFAAAVEKLVGRPDTHDAAILISSNPFMSDAEAAIISEWVSRERKSGTYLVRGTKLLERIVPSGDGRGAMQVVFRSDEEGLRTLDSVPISYVIVHTTPSEHPYAHHALLQRVLADSPAEWEKTYESQRMLDEPHEIEIYRCRRNLMGVPVHFGVDLNRKIGTSLDTGSEVK
jgi:hypothetical protein